MPIQLDASKFNPYQANSSTNRTKKLEGSYGITAVIPMPTEVHITIQLFMEQLIKRQHLLCVQPSKTIDGSNRFLDAENIDKTEESRVIATIEKLHTTIAAWQVIDAVDENSWINELIRSKLCSQLAAKGYDVFGEGFARSLVYDNNTNQTTENYILELENAVYTFKIDVNDRALFLEAIDFAKLNYSKNYGISVNPENIQPFTLIADSIKLNNDGNLLIQWKSSRDLKNFRQELAKHGGLAKWGENVATTIAYFPNWDRLSPAERQSIRYDIENMLNNSIIYEKIGVANLESMLVKPEKLRQVSFSRNNLAANSANWETSIAIFEEDLHLNMDCLSIKMFTDLKRELDPLSSPVSVIEAVNFEFHDYKANFQIVLDEMLEPENNNPNSISTCKKG